MKADGDSCLAQALDEHDRDDEDDDDRDDVDEDPDESDQDADEDGAEVGETVPCPFCKRPVHEDADLCRHCRNYIGGEDAPRRRVPPFVWIGAALAALGAMTWVLL